MPGPLPVTHDSDAGAATPADPTRLTALTRAQVNEGIALIGAKALADACGICTEALYRAAAGQKCRRATIAAIERARRP
jgi:hypothetical protein